jgi:hypothetical protein
MVNREQWNREVHKAFSLLNTQSIFLTLAVVRAPLATQSVALVDSASSASVTAPPTHDGDAFDDHSKHSNAITISMAIS